MQQVASGNVSRWLAFKRVGLRTLQDPRKIRRTSAKRYQELRAALAIRRGVDWPAAAQIHLVNQRGRLQRVIAPFTAQVRGRAPKLPIEQLYRGTLSFHLWFPLLADPLRPADIGNKWVD